MAASSPEYMRSYMRQWRAGQKRGRRSAAATPRVRTTMTSSTGEVRPHSRMNAHMNPKPAFRPLAPDDQRPGHCTFCGLRSLEDVCGFCRQEIEEARS